MDVNPDWNLAWHDLIPGVRFHSSRNVERRGANTSFGERGLVREQLELDSERETGKRRSAGEPRGSGVPVKGSEGEGHVREAVAEAAEGAAWLKLEEDTTAAEFTVVLHPKDAEGERVR